MRRLLPILVLLAACSRNKPATLPAPIPRLDAKPQALFALKYIDERVGTGAPAVNRKCVFAHYTGWLTDGKKFDSSRDTMRNGQPGNPLGFQLGARRVISGWDLGFDGMRVGGKRRLIIPYQLAYGERGSPPAIPPKAELIFDVELMAVADTIVREATPASGGGGGGGSASGSATGGRGNAPAVTCPAWTAVSGRG